MSEFSFASRFDGITGSAIREIFKLIAVPGMISFAGGNPNPEYLDGSGLAPIAEKLLREKGPVLLQYGATEGYGPFLESVKEYIRDRFQAEAREDEILPVTGSTQAMDLMCKALIDPGDAVIVEDPTFLGNMQCIRLYQARLVPVPSDEEGMDMDALEEALKKEKPKMIYVIPTFQNPTGRTLSLERRKRLAELAGKYRVVVAEDDPYRDLRYEGRSLPSVKSLDQSGYVALMGSFSKVISPGMRVGFLNADKTLLRKCVIGKQSSDLHTALLNQAMVDAYLRQGLLGPHVEKLCAGYGMRLKEMLKGLETCAGIEEYTRPEGGLFIFVRLKDGLDAGELLHRAVEKGVAYVPGTHFYAEGGHQSTLRLNFSMPSVENIRKGMALLNETFENALR